MPREITRVEVPEPEPMHTTPEGGAETQGAAYRLSAPAVATEPLTVTAPDGTALTWVPTELCYRDESGRMDYIVGSAPATVQVRDREARYQRTFPVADDVFLAEAERVKHWVILHEPPRPPAEYLSGAIEFGVTGLVSGIQLPEGRHDEIEAGPFRLPRPVARDLTGKEIAGYYEVVPAEGGQQLFVWFSAAGILAAVYPVTIDPTVIVASSGIVLGDHDGPRHLAKGPDGAYYMAVVDGNKIVVYRSADRGQTWSALPDPGFTATKFTSPVIFADSSAVYLLFDYNSGGKITVIARKWTGSGWASFGLLGAGAYTPRLVDAISDDQGYRHAVEVTADSGDVSSARAYYYQADPSRTSFYSFYRNLKSYGVADPFGWQFATVVAHGTRVIVVARFQNTVDTFVSTDRGDTFSTLSGVPNDGGALPYDGCAAAAPDGTIWFTYVLRTGGAHEVRLRWWTGSTWSAPIIVASMYEAYYPKITFVGANTIMVFWSGRADSGAPLQVYFRTREGTTWGNVFAVSPSAVNQYTVHAPVRDDAVGFPVAWLEQNGSAYRVVSEQVRTNTAPMAPLLGAIEALDATEDTVFTWTFVDPDPGDMQTAYQLVIRDGVTNEVVYDTGKVASDAQQHRVPAGTLVNGKQYRWTVRTWDRLDGVGPYAPDQVVVTSARPVATITYPGEGAIITTAPTVTWSVSDPESKGQSAYQVVLRDASGNVVYDSGKVQSVTAREHALPPLDNYATYTVELIVWDGDGVASAPVSSTFSTSFTPPPMPDITVEALEAWVRINVTNNNAGAEIAAVSNDIYRRKVGETGSGTRVASGVPVDGAFDDYAVASGVAYEYRVVAIGTNGATAASAWVQAPVLKLTGAWLHDPADPANTIRRFRVAADRSESWEPAAETFQFAGRKFPVAEFGEQTDQRVRTAIIVLPDSLADLHALRSLADLRTVLCYRDSAGRRIFGVLGPLNIRDERHGGYTVDLEITAVDYDEAV